MKCCGALRQLAFAAMPLVLTLGCGSTDSVDGAAAGSGGGGASGATSGASGFSQGGGTSPGELHGSVVVTLVVPLADAEGHTTLLGRFFDGPTPNPFPVELDSEQDGCELLVPLSPFCSEPCSPAVCTADDECTSYPKPQGVGSLSVVGLGDPLMLAPASSMFLYQPPSLSYPPCEEGAAVAVSASGFELSAECIAPLELTGADPIPVHAGEVVHVEWVPSAAASSSRIRIGLDVSHHGGKKGEIECEVPDTGSFDIPEPLVTKLVGLGLAGFPTINVNRVSVGVDAANPDLALTITSDVTRAVDTGVISCQDNVECSDGQTCLVPAGICG